MASLPCAELVSDGNHVKGSSLAGAASVETRMLIGSNVPTPPAAPRSCAKLSAAIVLRLVPVRGTCIETGTEKCHPGKAGDGRPASASDAAIVAIVAPAASRTETSF